MIRRAYLISTREGIVFFERILLHRFYKQSWVNCDVRRNLFSLLEGPELTVLTKNACLDWLPGTLGSNFDGIENLNHIR